MRPEFAALCPQQQAGCSPCQLDTPARKPQRKLNSAQMQPQTSNSTSKKGAREPSLARSRMQAGDSAAHIVWALCSIFPACCQVLRRMTVSARVGCLP